MIQTRGRGSKLVPGTDSEYLRTTLGADTLGGWFTVLHLDRFRVLDLHFLPALHAIGFHSFTSL